MPGQNNKISVYLDGNQVGTLAETTDHRVSFIYTADWIRKGFSISPISLPLKATAFVQTKDTVQELWGVFADSLPDDWGRVLVDRLLKERGQDPDCVSELERLTFVGENALGALTYRKVKEDQESVQINDIDDLYEEYRTIINNGDVKNFDTLFQLGASCGGTKPKIMTEEWIIKFPASGDMKDAGQMEKDYMVCAKDCGINVPETKLIPSKECNGFYAVKRFDRTREDGRIKKRSTLTAAAILEKNWKDHSTDYHDLIRLANTLSGSNEIDLLQMYRRMCFNVFAHNQDDHLKNFSWIHNRERNLWRLSPAYDLTWSNTSSGKRMVAVNGNSKNPGIRDLTAVGTAAGLSMRRCRQIIDEIEEKTRPLELKYRSHLFV